VIVDGLDAMAVGEAVGRAEPEVVIHQMTQIGPVTSLHNFDRLFEVTNRLRTEGTDHLLAAANAAGARRFIAQSFTGWPNIRSGDTYGDRPGEFRQRLAHRVDRGRQFRARRRRRARPAVCDHQDLIPGSPPPAVPVTSVPWDSLDRDLTLRHAGRPSCLTWPVRHGRTTRDTHENRLPFRAGRSLDARGGTRRRACR
jgi:hypothetical protein